MDFCVLLGNAHISGTPLKLPGELHYCCGYLPYFGPAQMQVELITLEPVMDMLSYLPLGAITMIYQPSPINLYHSQYTTSH